MLTPGELARCLSSASQRLGEHLPLPPSGRPAEGWGTGPPNHAQGGWGGQKELGSGKSPSQG